MNTQPFHHPMITLQLLAAIDPHRAALAKLLIDCVHSGASVGFVPPLAEHEALAYWDGVAADMRSGGRLLLVAMQGDDLVGAVQLSLCGKKNGLHRAEVEKLMVHTAHRRQGIGHALVQRIEQMAHDQGRTLLILDSRSDDMASGLYLKRGFIEAGRIPGYALSAAGTLEGTTYFYKGV